MHQQQDVLRSRSGFTLIELLIVIAIIAILAAILFPVFSRARENARRASCMNNMKQLGLAVMQYTQDYDEKYPLSWFGRIPGGPSRGSYTQTDASMPGAHFTTIDPSGGAGSSGNWITWMDMIYPYVKSIQVYRCPSSVDAETVPDYHYSGAFGNTPSNLLANTGTNNWESGRYGNLIARSALPLAAVQRPSEIVMIYEMSGSGPTKDSPFAAYQMRGNPFSISNSGRMHEFKIHLEGGNVAYGDGHVKWKSHAKMMAEINSSTDSGNCILSSIDESLAYCSPFWNPFR